MRRAIFMNSYALGGLGGIPESPMVNVVADVGYAMEAINRVNADALARAAASGTSVGTGINITPAPMPVASQVNGINTAALVAGLGLVGVAVGAAASGKKADAVTTTAKAVTEKANEKPATATTATPPPAGLTSKPSDIPEPPKSMPPPDTLGINLPEEASTQLKGTKGWKDKTPTSIENAVLATEENKKYAESKGMTKTIPGPDGKEYYVTPADYDTYKIWQAAYAEKGGKIPPPTVVENLGGDI